VINERNFDLFRTPTSWDDFRSGQAFRGNGEEFQLSAQPGTQFSRYSATFREPYLFDTLFGFQDSLYFYQRQYNEYLEERIGDKVSITRMLDPYWRASLSVRAEAVEVKNPPSYAGPGITDYVGWHALYGVRLGLTRDSRDSILLPTSGSVFDIGVEQVMGDYAFPIFTAEYTKLLSSDMAPFAREDGSGKHVLALRSQLSIEGDNAPVYERFFAGGFRSIRGFTFRGVGPSQNDLMVGGTFMFLNSIEYQIPILQNDKLHFVTFVDSGTVEQSVEIKNYRVSAGFGFRINVPALGPQPIALDFAFPIIKTATDNTQVFSFYVGMFGL
jgi:outer membrane protein assembly factor BamA